MMRCNPMTCFRLRAWYSPHTVAPIRRWCVACVARFSRVLSLFSRPRGMLLSVGSIQTELKRWKMMAII